MKLFGTSQQPQQPLSDAESLAQIMQGNLKGQLSGGDKLLALSALLKSVSRGSQTSPQQVMQQLQQQKMQEVQGRIQIAELQKQAARQAQVQQFREQLASMEKDPQKQAFLRMASPDVIEKIMAEQFKGAEPVKLAFDPLGRPRNPYTGAVVSPTAQIRGLPTVASDDQFDALPSGAEFVDPEGNIRRKP